MNSDENEKSKTIINYNHVHSGYECLGTEEILRLWSGVL